MTTLSIVIPTTGRGSLERAVETSRKAADDVIVVADGCQVTTDADLVLNVTAGTPGAARNHAIPYITGDWVGFCDDDDALVPGVYRAAVDILADEWDMVVMTMDDPDLGLIPRPGMTLFHGNVGISFAIRSELWRRHPFLPGPPETIAEDYGMVRLFDDLGYRVAVVSDVAYLVRPLEAS